MRIPHPDPRTEAQLQQVLSLRVTIEAKETLLEALYRHLADFRRKLNRHPQWVRASYWERQGNLVQKDIRDLEKEIPALHGQIAGIIAGIDDNDLAYLGETMPARKTKTKIPWLSLISGGLGSLAVMFAFRAQWHHIAETEGGAAVFLSSLCITTSLFLLAAYLTGGK